MEHRAAGYALLAGNGLEIGAFNRPAPLPAACRTRYCDVIAPDMAATLFPELDPGTLVAVDDYVDLDRHGLAIYPDDSFDYVILNHVIEHVANPVRVVAELFRVLRPGGKVVLSAPDKRYTFDRERASTDFAHLRQEFCDGVCAVTPEHFADLAQSEYPEAFSDANADFIALLKQRYPTLFAGDGRAAQPAFWEQLRALAPGMFVADGRQAALAFYQARREHAHVWDSNEFHHFLIDAFPLAGIRASLCLSSTAEANGGEYFSVWNKES
jgi:SAM-dependent methyltransferase